MLQQVVAQGAHHPVHRDAVVGVEVLVFSGNKGVDDERRHGLDGLEQAPFMCIFGEQGAVGGVHPGGHRRLIILEHGIVRQVLGQLRQVNGRAADHADEGEGEQTEKPSQDPKHQPANRLLPAGAVGRRSESPMLPELRI